MGSGMKSKWTNGDPAFNRLLEVDGECLSTDVFLSELGSWIIRDSIAFSLISKTSSGDTEKAGEVGDW
jgi:hypothetical protein